MMVDLFHCVYCGKSVVEGDEQQKTASKEFFPFCSEFCKVSDLDSWLKSLYSLSTEDQNLLDD